MRRGIDISPYYRKIPPSYKIWNEIGIPAEFLKSLQDEEGEGYGIPYRERRSVAGLGGIAGLGGAIPEAPDYNTVRGLTDASRRPISPLSPVGISPQELMPNPLTGYPENWMG